MRNVARGAIVALLLVGGSSAIRLSAQAPAANPLIGTWKFNVAKSKMNLSLPPKDLTRTYEDRGNGVYIFMQTGHGADGIKVQTLYVAKDDGTDYPLVKAGADALPSGYIAFKKVDNFTAQQTEKTVGRVSVAGEPGALTVTATATRVISPDGKTMTVTVRGRAQGGGNDDAGGTAAGQRERPSDEVDIMVFDKIS